MTTMTALEAQQYFAIDEEKRRAGADRVVDEVRDAATNVVLIEMHETQLRLERLEESRANFTEHNRVDRWHTTYNASLTGSRARGLEDWAVRDDAVEDADRAHGPLKPEEKT